MCLFLLNMYVIYVYNRVFVAFVIILFPCIVSVFLIYLYYYYRLCLPFIIIFWGLVPVFHA